MARQRSRAATQYDEAKDKVAAVAARLNKAIPGAGDQLLVDAAACLTGFLDRHAQTLAGPAASARIRADANPPGEATPRAAARDVRARIRHIGGVGRG